MFLGIVVTWAVVALSFAITSWALPDMDVTGGFWGYVWVSLLFGLVSAVIGTLLRIVTAPLMIITLGLISIVVNAVLLQITDALTDNLEIDGFWTSIWAAIIMAVVTIVLGLIVSLVLRPKPGQPVRA